MLKHELQHLTHAKPRPWFPNQPGSGQNNFKQTNGCNVAFLRRRYPSIRALDRIVHKHDDCAPQRCEVMNTKPTLTLSGRTRRSLLFLTFLITAAANGRSAAATNLVVAAD